MPEAGLSAAEVGKEIAEHLERNRDHGHETRARRITIIEAILLASVALLAAWSGFAAAEWGTESRLSIARASTARTEASELDLASMEERNLDAITFDVWFEAYLNGDPEDVAVAERLFRPEFAVAFDAWLATDPFTDPDAPGSPFEMEEYEQPEKELAAERRDEADAEYAQGAEEAATGDDYVRTTVLLASVLFLIGISGHFRMHAARVGLVAVSGIILTYAVVLLIQAPKP
jgi:hypothetical protein